MTLDLAKLRAETLALIDGTTPGPWQPYGQSIKANGWCDTFNGSALADVARAHDTEQADYEGRVWGVAGNSEANARLIAAAPTLAADTLRLLDEIEQLRDVLERIAVQKRSDELETAIDVKYADFEDGYNFAVDEARAALAEGGPDDR